MECLVSLCVERKFEKETYNERKLFNDALRGSRIEGWFGKEVRELSQ